MISRLSQIALLATTSSFACVASTKCLPDVYAKRFTLVKGNADAAMVQEYSIFGCYELEVDSIVRRSVSPESLSVPKSWTNDRAPASPAVTIHASYVIPDYDSIGMLSCAKVRTIRRVDSIPRVSIPVVLEGSDLSGETPVPVDPDSVFVCLNGNCSRIVPRVVENAVDPVNCLAGALAPLPTPEAALDYLKDRIKASPAPSMLHRFPPITWKILCRPVVGNSAARSASLFPVHVKETRLAYTDENNYALPSLRDWTDTTVSKRLTLPSSGNAGDFHAPETLQFSRTSLFGATDEATTFEYPTGIERYFYKGSTPSPDAYCIVGPMIPKPVPTMVGDTLRLEGLSLNLSTETDCPTKGIDIHAGKHFLWLFAPSGEASPQQDFFHGANAETQFSWPVESDSVLVRGQKVALAKLEAFVSTLPRPDERRFTARVLDGALSLTLEHPGKLRISTLDGRVLSTMDAPAGRSRIALPQGHRGILLVSEGNRTVRIPAP